MVDRVSGREKDGVSGWMSGVQRWRAECGDMQEMSCIEQRKVERREGLSLPGEREEETNGDEHLVVCG